MFELELKPKALKALRKLERKVQLEVNSALNALRAGDFCRLDIKKIEGTKHGHRIRVGRWRILISLSSKEKQAEIVDIFLKRGEDDYQKRKHLLK